MPLMERLRDAFLGALAVLVILVLFPGMASSGAVPALILIALIGIGTFSLLTNHRIVGIVAMVASVLWVIFWFIPGVQIALTV